MLVRLVAVNVQPRQKGRRGAHRYALTWEVRITVNAPAREIAELSGTLRDLSSTGAFVYLSHSVQLGRMVVVSVRLPLEKETWMNLTGTVIRVTTHTERPGIAIQFNQTRPEFTSPSLEMRRAPKTTTGTREVS
jgi:c-di-GMP-binding flagellar brake protein YcgR